MTDRIVVRRGSYHDSVELMAVSRDLGEAAGVEDAAVVMATPLNLRLLTDRRFAVPHDLGPNDLLIAVRGRDEAAANAAVAGVERRLDGSRDGDRRARSVAAPISIRAAARQDPGLSLAVVSVPGRHAAGEIVSALDAGLHVFCFSAGPTEEQEAALKSHARRRGLFLMGPDCGTAIVNGVGLGFANAVRRGPVGIVAASGTGAQELACLLDQAGIGISQLIGVGGRDLREAVGAQMTLAALDALARDAETDVIAVVSKPPHPGPARTVLEAAARVDKPVVPVFLGSETDRDAAATTGEEAAGRIAELLGRSRQTPAAAVLSRPTPGHVRGLFCGASVAAQVLSALRGRGADVASNLDPADAGSVDALEDGTGDAVIDFGDEQLTEGRPHPMIDPGLRDARLGAAMLDRSVGVVVADVVLGSGSHPDPAGSLAPVIQSGMDRRRGAVTAIVVLCGTELDPQDMHAQESALRRAGALVVRSAAAAARLALEASAG